MTEVQKSTNPKLEQVALPVLRSLDMLSAPDRRALAGTILGDNYDERRATPWGLLGAIRDMEGALLRVLKDSSTSSECEEIVARAAKLRTGLGVALHKINQMNSELRRDWEDLSTLIGAEPTEQAVFDWARGCVDEDRHLMPRVFELAMSAEPPVLSEETFLNYLGNQYRITMNTAQLLQNLAEYDPKSGLETNDLRGSLEMYWLLKTRAPGKPVLSKFEREIATEPRAQKNFQEARKEYAVREACNILDSTPEGGLEACRARLAALEGFSMLPLEQILSDERVQSSLLPKLVTWVRNPDS